MVWFCSQATPKIIQKIQACSRDPRAAQHDEKKPLKVHDHRPECFPIHGEECGFPLEPGLRLGNHLQISQWAQSALVPGPN